MNKIHIERKQTEIKTSRNERKKVKQREEFKKNCFPVSKSGPSIPGLKNFDAVDRLCFMCSTAIRSQIKTWDFPTTLYHR